MPDPVVPPDADRDPAPVRELMLVSAGGEVFAIALDLVREVVPARPYTTLPGAPNGVCGLANVRGRIVTVVELAARMGLDAARAAGHRVVLLDHAGRLVGLAVDEVVRIVRAPVEEAGQVRPDPTEGEDPAAEPGPRFTEIDADALLSPLFGDAARLG